MTVFDDQYLVGPHVFEELGRVCDENESAFFRERSFEKERYRLQSVDIDTGIDFVEEDELRFDEGYLQCFKFLFFSAGESVVERAGKEFVLDMQGFRRYLDFPVEFEDIVFFLEGRAEEITDGNSRKRQRILKGHAETEQGAFVRREAFDILSVPEELARSGEREVRVPHDDACQCRFSGSVRSEYGVGLSGLEGVGDIIEDSLLFD